MWQDEELKAVSEGYETAVRNVFDVLQNNLVPMEGDGLTVEEREAKAIVSLKTGLAFVRRVRQLAEEVINRS